MSKGNPAHLDFVKRVQSEINRGKSLEEARKKVKTQVLKDWSRKKKTPGIGN